MLFFVTVANLQRGLFRRFGEGAPIIFGESGRGGEVHFLGQPRDADIAVAFNDDFAGGVQLGAHRPLQRRDAIPADKAVMQDTAGEAGDRFEILACVILVRIRFDLLAQAINRIFGRLTPGLDGKLIKTR